MLSSSLKFSIEPMKSIFVYGSLLNPTSAAQALMRPVDSAQLYDAKLIDYRLDWTSVHPVFAEQQGRIVDAAFLNVHPSVGAHVLGQLMQVSEEEFTRLSLREKGYTAKEVTCLNGSGSPELAWTFVDERPLPTAELVVLTAYIDKIKQGAAYVGPSFYEEYVASLPHPSLPLIQGPYIFVDETQKKYT